MIDCVDETTICFQVESVINAVTAIAYGLDSTLRFYCGNNYQSICGAFLNSADKGAKFLAEIKNVRFPVEDKSDPNMFKFVGRSGAVPFEINNFRSRNYQKVKWVTVETPCLF